MDYDNEKLVSIYLKMRAARSALAKAYETEDAAIKADMAMIESLLGAVLQRNKAKNMATGAGSFYTETTSKASCIDWPAFYAWVAEQNAFGALEKRVGQNFIAEWARDHDGKLPPGIATYKEQVVRVRVGND